MFEDRFQVFWEKNVDYNDVLVELQLKVLSDVLMFRWQSWQWTRRFESNNHEQILVKMLAELIV